MARAVRFTKPEREILLYAIDELVTLPAGKGANAKRKALDSAKTKIEASELLSSKREGGAPLSVGKAIDAFREVLGDRLVVPPTPGKLFWITMSRGLGVLGADEEQCRRIATVGGDQWQGHIKAESLVRQGAVLLNQWGSFRPAAATARASTPKTTYPNNLGADLDEL